METRNDFRSIQPFLPLILRSSAVFWPPSVVEALKCLSKGPSQSNVNSGQLFALAIGDLRNSLGFYPLNSSASLGVSVFFDDLMSKNEAEKWFGEVVPRLADLLLRLPALLETHYQTRGPFNGMETGLRLLDSQESGIVFLSQELVAALLVCALFCLFPTSNRGAKDLPLINFDTLFVCLYECYDVNQEHKIKCLVHYFEKICSDMPMGNVSFERKVLPLKNSSSSYIVYPDVDFWSESTISLCPLEVLSSGLIEDHLNEALEVDFANKYIGGGALGRGCVQEEIRFMINPELIASMLFFPSMADNEAIEIVGAQRFSDYTGYAKSFRFVGDYMEKKSVDKLGRLKTRIVAIDALCSPGRRQYRLEGLLREINKAFCGFFYEQKRKNYQKLFKENGSLDQVIHNRSQNSISAKDDPSASFQEDKQTSYQVSTNEEGQGEVGVATGNWGCGAFGGDPQVKVVIQWLAASQALRPFILYYAFSLEPLQKLEKVVNWIQSQGWTVGELWNILLEYSTQRLNGETRVGLFRWLLPSLEDDDPMVVDVPHCVT